ncbi:Staygreen domain-containing protein [Psidium guajava]|nr:Staygreen domain-containing protein [Psidium guajava]
MQSLCPQLENCFDCVFPITSVMRSRSGGAGNMRLDGSSATEKKAPTTNPTMAVSKVESCATCKV